MRLPATTQETATKSEWTSMCMERRSGPPRYGLCRRFVKELLSLGVRMRGEVELAPPAVAHVRVELGRREIRVAEHLLHRAEIRAALEQVRREGVAEQVRVDPLRLQSGDRGEAAQDQEAAGAGEGAAAGVQEEL